MPVHEALPMPPPLMTIHIFGVQRGGLGYRLVRAPPRALNPTDGCRPAFVNSDIRRKWVSRQDTWFFGPHVIPVANFAAYTFAPPILVTPLGALSVLIGLVHLVQFRCQI